MHASVRTQSKMRSDNVVRRAVVDACHTAPYGLDRIIANGHQPWVPVRQYAPAGSADIRHVVLFGARVVLAYMDTNTTFQLLVGAAAGPGQVRQVAQAFVSVPTTPEIDSDGSLQAFRRLTLDPAVARCVSHSGLHNFKVLRCIQRIPMHVQRGIELHPGHGRRPNR